MALASQKESLQAITGYYQKANGVSATSFIGTPNQKCVQTFFYASGLVHRHISVNYTVICCYYVYSSLHTYTESTQMLLFTLLEKPTSYDYASTSKMCIM